MGLLPDTPAAEARHVVSPAVSSIFNASAALGEAAGPLIGTWLLPENFQLGPKVRASKSGSDGGFGGLGKQRWYIHLLEFSGREFGLHFWPLVVGL